MWKKKILLTLAGLVLAFLVVVACQPADYRVTRNALLTAPPAAVFAEVNDFHHWEAWSPWAKMDPAARNTFSGTASGTGAVFAWAGNDKVGEGKMTLTESLPPGRILIRLEFLKPFENTSMTEFLFQPEGQGTRVTWTMTGHKGFLSKAICLFMNMDRMVGGDFEKGLANLQVVTGKRPG